jgi:2-methylcitrate synthase/citrate synthase II
MATENKSSYSPGLEGVIAGETSISQVDSEAGLIYRGYDIIELATNASFEEVTWLLLRGQLPTMSELASLSRELVEEHHLPPTLLDVLRLLPPQIHPIDSLRTGISALGVFDHELNDNSAPANLRKAVRLIAKTAGLVGHGWRLAHGLELQPPKTTLTQAGNLLYQLTGEVPDLWHTEIMDTVLVLYADHGYNASTFSARVTASTLADIYAAVTAAVATLKGPLHGGANLEAMKMLRDIGSPDRVDAWVKEQLAQKRKIMGFGHRVYQKGDARVPVMRDLARQLGNRFGQEHWVDICTRLEEVMQREKHLYANVDLYAAPVLFLLGIPPELNISIFACGRIAGWCAHILEQHSHNRLMRPTSLYTGPARREYPTRVKKSAA